MFKAIHTLQHTLELYLGTYSHEFLLVLLHTASVSRSVPDLPTTQPLCNTTTHHTQEMRTIVASGIVAASAVRVHSVAVVLLLVNASRCCCSCCCKCL